MKHSFHLASRLAILALAFTTVITLTACGGDDGDDIDTNVGGIPNNTHSKNIIAGEWYDKNNNYYYFDGTGQGRYYWRPEVTDMSCYFDYHVQGTGTWGSVFISATYHNYTGHTTWRDNKTGSYNVSEGRMIIGSTTYYRMTKP